MFQDITWLSALKYIGETVKTSQTLMAYRENILLKVLKEVSKDLA
jgi:hypothetical protein